MPACANNNVNRHMILNCVFNQHAHSHSTSILPFFANRISKVSSNPSLRETSDLSRPINLTRQIHVRAILASSSGTYSASVRYINMIHELRAWVKRAEMRWHGFIEHAKVYWGLGSWIIAHGLVVGSGGFMMMIMCVSLLFICLFVRLEKTMMY
jgi:hypothetical protein